MKKKDLEVNVGDLILGDENTWEVFEVEDREVVLVNRDGSSDIKVAIEDLVLKNIKVFGVK